MKRLLVALLPLAVSLAACDQINDRLGLEDPGKKEARQDAEGRAVGSACRQSGRAIEDCYAIYYWLPKASVFAGWREMNDYMLTNKLEIVQPRYEPPGSPEEMRRKRRTLEESEAVPAKADGEKAGEKLDEKADGKDGAAESAKNGGDEAKTDAAKKKPATPGAKG